MSLTLPYLSLERFAYGILQNRESGIRLSGRFFYRSSCFYTFLAWFFLLPAPTYAHGPAPSALRVIAVDNQQPEIVLTSLGIAARQYEQYIYRCPSQWGDSDLLTPLLTSTAAENIFLVGKDQFYLSENDGCSFSPLSSPADLQPTQLSGLLHDDQSIWLISNRLEDSNSQGFLWQWQERGGFKLAFHLSSQKLDSISVHHDTLWLASARPNLLFFLVEAISTKELPFNNDVIEEVVPTSIPLGTPSRISLRLLESSTSQTSIWAVVTLGQALALWVSDDTGASFQSIQSANTSIHGPVPICGGLIMAIDNAISFPPEHQPDCSLDPLIGRDIKCLHHIDGIVYFCEDRQLYIIDDSSGELSIASWFSLSEISGPDLSCIDDPDKSLACEIDWSHHRADTGDKQTTPQPDTVPIDANTDPQHSTSGHENCATFHASQQKGPVFFFLCLGLILCLRKQRF